MAGDEIAERLARLERQLEQARVELDAVRALAEASAPTVDAPVGAWAVASVVEEELPPPPPSAQLEPADGAAQLAAAWRALERGRAADALAHAEDAFRSATAANDSGLLQEIGHFATVAIATMRGSARTHAEDLAAAQNGNARRRRG